MKPSSPRSINRIRRDQPPLQCSAGVPPQLAQPPQTCLAAPTGTGSSLLSLRLGWAQPPQPTAPASAVPKPIPFTCSPFAPSGPAPSSKAALRAESPTLSCLSCGSSLALACAHRRAAFGVSSILPEIQASPFISCTGLELFACVSVHLSHSRLKTAEQQQQSPDCHICKVC